MFFGWLYFVYRACFDRTQFRYNSHMNFLDTYVIIRNFIPGLQLPNRQLANVNEVNLKFSCLNV